MSSEALAWAFKQDVKPSAVKFTLVALCECASYKTGDIFPSIEHLVEITGQDRKTVISNIDALIRLGFIADTGERAGRTKQIKVYRACLERVPQTEPSHKRNSTVSPPKQSQKRDTEPSREPSSSEAKASSNNGDRLLPEHIEETWNETAARLWKGRTIKGLVNGRRAGVKRLIASHELGDFVAVFASIEQSKFLREGRFCTFDWVMKPANFQKILEGNYNG